MTPQSQTLEQRRARKVCDCLPVPMYLGFERVGTQTVTLGGPCNTLHSGVLYGALGPVPLQYNEVN